MTTSGCVTTIVAPQREQTAGLKFSPRATRHRDADCLQSQAGYTCVHTAKPQGQKMMRNKKAAAGEPRYGQRMIFTGPDGIGDYRPRSNYFPQYIGVGNPSPGATGDLSYLCRAAPNGAPPVPRQGYVGEVGWGWQYNQLLNSGTLHSNMQIKKTEFREALEDKVTQRFQNYQYREHPEGK